MNTMASRIRVFCQNGSRLETIIHQLRKIPDKLKNQSTNILQACTEQCEYVVAQRFRRGQQMFCLYTRLWDEKALRELLKRMRHQMGRRGKEFVFGALGVYAYDWNSQRITDSEFSQQITNYNYIFQLYESTVICKRCNKRRAIDTKLPDITYCQCPLDKNESYVLDEWEPFLERKDLIIWRRPHRGSGSCFEYKVFGTYNDVTAENFLRVQVDTEYRQRWDTTAINLAVIDSDSSSNSDIVYWEMLWPRLFSNRDYVFNRRYMVDKENKICTIISKTTDHPACPVKPDKYRVTEYWSCMIIRPTSELDKPGIEFTLTYYDDPGVSIPSSVTTWVAMAGMPDFLSKLRRAAMNYHKTCVPGCGCSRAKKKPAMSESSPEPRADPSSRGGKTPAPLSKEEDDTPPSTLSATSDTNVEGSNYWRYLHPHYYLG